MTTKFVRGLMVAILAGILAGCGSDTTTQNSSSSGKQAKDKVATERDKLSAEDRALVDAQDKCVISEGRLGAMGPPIKLDIKGQPVFICCEGCKTRAESDPDKTLATLAELKAKKPGQ